jgi:hypothetical protein
MVEEEMKEGRGCPFRNLMPCIGEQCHMWIVTKNGFVLGCAFPAIAVKLDNVEFMLRK